MAMKNGLFAAERGLFAAVRGLRRTRFGAVRRGVCAALLALGALGAWGDDGVTSVEVAAGETLDLAENESANGPRAIITLNAGSTLKFGTNNVLRSYLRVKGGSATLIAPTGAPKIHLRGGVREVDDAAALVVDGVTTVALGGPSGVTYAYISDDGLYKGISCVTDLGIWPLVDAPRMTFTAEDAVGTFELQEHLFVRALPTAGTISVLADPYLGFETQAALARVVGVETNALANFSVPSGWNLMCCSDDVFPSGATVRVPGGSSLMLKPCTVGIDNQWFGVTATTADSGVEVIRAPYSNVSNYVLASDANGRARLVSASKRELHVMGTISGEGDVEVLGDMMYSERFVLEGALSYTGTTTVAGDKSALIVYAESAGAAANTLRVTSETARFALCGDPSLTGARPAKIGTLEMTSSGERGSFSGNSPLVEIGTFRGEGLLQPLATSSNVITMRVERVAAGSTLLFNSVLMPVAVEDGARLKTGLANGFATATLDLTAFTGDTLPVVDVTAGTTLTVIGGAGLTLPVTGGGTVRAPDCAAIARATSAADTLHIELAAGQTLTSFGDASWQQKVGSWFDASQEETLGLYRVNDTDDPITYTNGFPLVKSWACRLNGTSAQYLYNGRSFGSTGAFSDRHDEVYPFLVTNGLNGLSYMSFGSQRTQIPVVYQAGWAGSGTVTEARRLTMVTSGVSPDAREPTTNVACSYAIIVFGSAQGGGTAVLGNAGYAFARDQDLGNPFFSNLSSTVYLDGAETTGTQAYPNGGWQILSFPCSGKAVNALGWSTGWDNAGGQNYAEVILFKTEPSDGERRACELYLAKKWGLRAPDLAPAFRADGAGTVRVEETTALAGAFRGTVELAAGATLTLPDEPLPPGEEAVVAENRLLWLDPNAEGALAQSGFANRPLCIKTFWPRTETGVVSGGEGMSATDRQPWADTSAHGLGEVRTWLDFANIYDGDVNGNTLRHQNPVDGSSGSTPIGAVREIFMALDTSRGGGSVLGTDVYFSYGQGRSGGGRITTAAIWSSSHPVVSAGVTTRLDNETIDGRSTGFTGRPEVLGVTTTSAWSPAFLGYFGESENANKGPMILGESIYYSQPLEEAARAKVVAYLLYKWCGRALAGYSDLTRMTVTGAGRVEAPRLRALPQFAADFSGTVACTATDLAFTLAPAENGAAALDAVASAVPLTLAAGATVTVTCRGAATPGTYTLVSAPALAVEGGALPALVFTGEAASTAQAALSLANGRLVLTVVGGGTVIVVR